MPLTCYVKAAIRLRWPSQRRYRCHILSSAAGGSWDAWCPEQLLSMIAAHWQTFASCSHST